MGSGPKTISLIGINLEIVKFLVEITLWLLVVIVMPRPLLVERRPAPLHYG